MADLKPLQLNRVRWRFRGVTSYKVLIFIVVILVVVGIWGNLSSASVFSYVFGSSGSLQKEKGRVNILLLGTAGSGHDGPNLTDTIMVASYDLAIHRVVLISLPRDLWLDEYKTKANSLYQIGLTRGNGLDFTKEVAGKILGISVPYAVRVDFNGFIKAIDLVGGVEVNIPNSFTDYQYPVGGKQNDTCEYKEIEMDIDEGKSQELGVKSGKLKVLLDPTGTIATAAAEPGKDIIYTDEGVLTFFHCRFEGISFEKGRTLMDGATALKYVRSRHGNNGEGSDFARSRRQQLVLQAFKDKVLAVETLLDPRKVVDLVRTFGMSVDSDIPQSQYLEFIKLAKNIVEVRSFVIDGNGENPLLVSPPLGDYGAWVLVPQGDDFSRVQAYIQGIFSGTLEASTSARQNND